MTKNSTVHVMLCMRRL